MDKNIKCYADGYKVDSKKTKYFPMLPSENFVRIYREFIKFKKNLTCLDFGCGDGRHSKFLLDHKNKVIGTDVSKESINLTNKNIKNKNLKTIEFKNEEYLDNLLIEYDRFDLILCWETIHWLGDYKRVKKLLFQFKKILKKNGLITVTFPAEDHYLIKNLKPISKSKKFTYLLKNNERKGMYICAPNLEMLKKLFKKNKLKILAIYKYAHGRKFLDKKNNLTFDYKNLFSMYAFVLKNE